MQQIQILKAFSQSNTYQRFIKVPGLLSLALAVVVFALLQEAYWILIPSGVGKVVGAIPAIIASFLIADFVAFLANRHMTRERLWEWGNGKFGSWREMSEWINNMPAAELDRLVGLKDDEWHPDDFKNEVRDANQSG